MKERLIDMDMNHIEVIIVLDRSGSMQRIRADMEGGLDRFFEDQRKEPGRCSVTLTQFDNEYEVVYSGLDIKDVPKAELVPRGNTALLDAVGRTINVVGKRLYDTPEHERPKKVIFLIITDGLENASREFTRGQVKQMIDEQTSRYSWEFVYIGANQDAFAEAQKLGIATSQGYEATPGGTRRVVSDISEGVLRARRGGTYRTN